MIDNMKQGWRQIVAGLMSFAALTAVSLPAHALPSYARQTGEECSACHVGGFGPQLTPHGVKFKIGGYTDTDGKEGHIPLSAMLVANSATMRKGSPDMADDARANANNNITVQEFSVFLAGRLAPHVGSFSQITYSGVDRKASLDNVDLRYAREISVGDTGATVGLSVNNNPTVQDPFNTLPAWRFPYTSPDLAVSPGAAPLLDGALAGAVYGTTGYAFLDNGLYMEAGGYNNIGQKTLKHVNIYPDAMLDGTAPYARLAFFKDLHSQAFSLGLVALNGRLRDIGSPGGGPTDKFVDTGLDASYQYLGNRRHIFTLDANVVDEAQKRYRSASTGGATNLTGNLRQLNLSGSYYYDKTYGLTARFFNIQGSADAAYYADGYLNGSPNTRGLTLQADWSPFSKTARFGTLLNARVGVQYTAYDRFNGARSGQEILMPSGDLRTPGDNNVLSLFFWGAY